MMNFSAFLLKTFGWSVTATVPDYPKCIICVAPHTSNWDFILGELTIHSLGRKAAFMMKSSWFFFPLGCLFRAMGGIPVERGKKQNLVDTIVNRFNTSKELTLAITPEGTRKKTAKWHTGFLRIAFAANVPNVLGAIDAARKRIEMTKVFHPTGDIMGDIEKIKEYYRQFRGVHPDNFSTDPQPE